MTIAGPTSTVLGAVAEGSAAASHMLSKLRHDPAAIAVTRAVPVVLVLMFGYLLGSAIPVPGRGNYREFLVPGLMAMLAFNVTSAMVMMARDSGRGVVDRFRSLPITRVAIPFGQATAQAANLAGLAVSAGLIAVAGCLLAGRLLLPEAGINPAHGYALVSLDDGPTLRAATGSVLYLALIALLSLGVATAIRDTAASIGAMLALLYLPPIAAQVVQDPTWRQHLEQIAPTTAGLAIQATTDAHSQPIGPWAGLGVLAAWTAGALLIAGVLLRARDA
jgi:hypothetical protein